MTTTIGRRAAGSGGALVLLLLVLAPAGLKANRAAAADGPLAPALEGLGAPSMAITTRSDGARRFFDQGLRLLYAFNHQEAVRSFREAARLDPDAPMPHWGVAFALGPNINDPIVKDRERQALQALGEARARRGRGTERERGLIDALGKRYSGKDDADRAGLDAAYAAAMGRLVRRFPDDPDLEVLRADAVMNTMPWNYWTADGELKPEAREALAAVERVIARHPEHTGAHHYLIHLVEGSADPDRGVASADRLGGLAPGAGHLVHMPSHIYLRVGRYADASDANERAIVADEGYLTACRRQGLYPVGYYPHNIHFLWAAATMEGRSAAAIDAARKTATRSPHESAGCYPMLLDFRVTPLLALVRFGRWEEILREPRPDGVYGGGIWHYARGLAFNATGKAAEAGAEQEALDAVVADPAMQAAMVSWNSTPAARVLKLAALVLAGERAARAGRHDQAVAALRDAAAIEDAFPYQEPPAWHHPVRQVLGAVLLEAGRAGEAEAIFRDDLARNRENGWALYGLTQALRAGGKTADAGAAEARFRKAWARADVVLTAARF